MDNERRMTMDRFFGGVDGRIPLLQDLLAHVDANQLSREELVDWILERTNAESRSAVNHHLAFLASLDLIDFSEEQVTLASAGEDYPFTARRLFDIFRTHVKGLDTILEALADESHSNEELRELLVEEFDEAEMEGTGPAIRHREWLQALGYLRYEDGESHLTGDGRKVLSEIWEDEEQTDLPTPETGRAITDFLQILSTRAKAADIELEVDSSETFQAQVRDTPSIKLKIRRSVSQNRNSQKIWQRFNREVEAIDSEEDSKVIGVQLDIDSNERYDPHEDHFIYLPSDLLRQEASDAGDLTISIINDGSYETPFDAYADDWEGLLEKLGSETNQTFDRKPITPTAPYYWATHNANEFEKGFLQAPVDSSPSHDLRKLNPGDVVFSYFEKHLHGVSIVEESPRVVEIDGESHWRVNIDTYPFEEPIGLSSVLPYLMRPDVQLGECYPIHEAGIHSRYLCNLSREGGEHLLEFSGVTDQYPEQLSDLSPTPFADLLAGVSVSVSLPSHLHYPGGDQERLEREINAALAAGKHLILTGPPGTGKSDIATEITESAAQQSDAVDDARFTTATSAWTTYDTIGGYEPSPKEGGIELTFSPRLFLSCFRDSDTKQIRNDWLVIDELNRANIDESLGQLFSVLSQDSVELPYEDDEQVRIDWVDEDTDTVTRAAILSSQDRYPVTPAWRLIGTMNTKDKASLYDLSFAFMRRFGFVHVPAPSLWLDDDTVDGGHLDPAAGPNYATTWARGATGNDLSSTLDEYHAELSVVWALINEYRGIGPAIIKDMIEHLRAHEGGDESMALTSAITTYIFPQLNGIRKEKQEAFLKALVDSHSVATDQGEHTIELRIDAEVLERQGRDRFGLGDLSLGEDSST